MTEINVHAGKIHFSGIGLFQKIQTAQECRLPRPAGAKDNDDIAFFNIHMHVFQDFQIAKALADVFD